LSSNGVVESDDRLLNGDAAGNDVGSSSFRQAAVGPNLRQASVSAISIVSAFPTFAASAAVPSICPSSTLTAGTAGTARASG
jgi:hypothetical protein